MIEHARSLTHRLAHLVGCASLVLGAYQCHRRPLQAGASARSSVAVLVRYCAVLMCLLSLNTYCWALTPIPAPSAPVIDQAGFLSAREKAALTTELLNFYRDRGSQIAVLIVAQVAPETPFDYGTRVMESWKLGRAGVDDGVLLLLVTAERRSQLLVGRGLEGALPDVIAKRILQEILAPKLADGQREEAILAAVKAIQKAIRQEALPLPPDTKIVQQPKEAASDWHYLAFIVLVVGGVLKKVFGRLFGSVLTGALTAVLALILGTALLKALGFGVVGGVATLLLGRRLAVFGGGGSSGGSSGGWGGGGDYGGGGASGRW